MKTDFKSILSILLVSSSAGLVYNYFSPEGIPYIPEEKILNWASDSLFLEHNYKSGIISDSLKEMNDSNITIKEEQKINDIKTTGERETVVSEPSLTKKEEEFTEPVAINLNQAYSLFQKNILFIDAREPADYQESHIKNSVNIPFDYFDDYKHLLNGLDKEKPIVTYCAGTDCDLSIMLGDLLFEQGYRKVYIFFGGWNEWLEAGYPTEKADIGL